MQKFFGTRLMQAGRTPNPNLQLGVGKKFLKIFGKSNLDRRLIQYLYSAVYVIRTPLLFHFELFVLLSVLQSIKYFFRLRI